jgi:hypothetical protein
VNVSAASHVGGALRSWNRHGPALQAVARAWKGLGWRHWLIAVGVGVLLGAVYATFEFLYSFRGFVSRLGRDAPLGDVFLMVLTRWTLLMTGVSCALAVALARLGDISKRGEIRPRDVVLTILAVTAFGVLVADPIAIGAEELARSWLRIPGQRFANHDWLTTLSRMSSYSVEKIFTVAGTATFAAVYYLKNLRANDALAIAQVGLSRAQKHRLTEELRSAQAMLDPEFVFATLDGVDRRFVGDPQVARRLLDALIRYLRAALPADDDTMGTLGQQVMLVRAYMEVEAVRSAGRIQAVFDVPVVLETRPFAPALILPLLALARGSSASCERDTELLVRASVAAGRLVVEVRCSGWNPGPTTQAETTLASLRQRLGALYGSGAEVSLVTRAGGGSTARIAIDDPEAA